MCQYIAKKNLNVQNFMQPYKRTLLRIICLKFWTCSLTKKKEKKEV